MPATFKGCRNLFQDTCYIRRSVVINFFRSVVLRVIIEIPKRRGIRHHDTRSLPARMATDQTSQPRQTFQVMLRFRIEIEHSSEITPQHPARDSVI